MIGTIIHRPIEPGPDLVNYTTGTRTAVQILSDIPGAVVAGGWARMVALGGKAPIAEDIDVFVLDEYAALPPTFLDLGYKVITTGRSPKYQHPRISPDIQIIRRSTAVGGPTMSAWRTPEDIISTFGFTTEMFALELTVNGLCLVTTDAAIKDTEDRVLRVNHVIDPIRLAYRANKYGLKGYTMSLPEMTNIFAYWDTLDPAPATAFYREDRLGCPEYPSAVNVIGG